MLCKLPLENNSGTLPNPLSRSFRTIGIRNNFLATTSSLRCSTYIYTLSIPSTKANFRVDARLLVSSRGTGRQSLPTSFAVLTENFLARAITSPSVHNLYHLERTIRTFFLGLIRRWSEQPLVPTPGHALRMTNARPPWQRGRQKPTKDRRRKKEPPELDLKREMVGNRSESGSELERKRKREKERGREK